jgi:photosystem II stability/assembly factor-like uncharacterized protein
MRGSVSLALCSAVFGSFFAACRPPAPARPSLARTSQSAPTNARLQAVMAVDDQVVWASGLEGSVLRSVDGGQRWHRLRVPDADALQFRDVHAFDAKRALLLSSGEGALSRIYKTEDGGQSWTMPFALGDVGFLDCFDFWDERRGLAYGDSVAGELFILRTEDGGTSWQRVDAKSLPAAGPGEGGFAASGTCVRVGTPGQAWIGTGAGGNARVLRTSDWGRSWQASEPPFVTGETAGIMSVVAVGDTLVALGGDLSRAADNTSNVASSNDGGKSWRIASVPTFAGPVYGSSSQGKILVAVGPKGVSVSSNAAQTWTRLDDGDYWSVAFGGASRFWVVGPVGKILRFDLRP